MKNVKLITISDAITFFKDEIRSQEKHINFVRECISANNVLLETYNEDITETEQEIQTLNTIIQRLEDDKS